MLPLLLLVQALFDIIDLNTVTSLYMHDMHILYHQQKIILGHFEFRSLLLLVKHGTMLTTVYTSPPCAIYNLMNAYSMSMYI